MADAERIDMLMTRRQAASFLRLSPATLATWASRSKGPAFFKAGGRAVYRMADLYSFLGITDMEVRPAIAVEPPKDRP